MRKLPRYITKEEYEQMLDYINERRVRASKLGKTNWERKWKEVALALILGFKSGMRISEIYGLKAFTTPCCNAVPEQRRIGKRLRRWFCSGCGKPQARGKLRRLDQNAWEIEPLTLTLEDINRHQVIRMGKGKKERAIFLPLEVTPKALELFPLKIARRSIQRTITVLAQKLFNKKITFHSLRHGFATHLVNKGVPLNEIQMAMGHSSIATTGIYLHANPTKVGEHIREVF